MQKKLSSNRKDDFYNWHFRSARLEAGYSRVRLANETGISKPAMESYERLRAFPCLNTAEKIASTIGRKKEEIFPEYLREMIKEVRIIRENYSRDFANNATSLDDISEEEILVSEDNIIEDINYAELKRRFESVLNLLADKHRKVIKMRFGLEDGHCYSLKETGIALGLTKERIRQIQIKAMRKLRSPKYASQLVEFID